MFGKNEFLFREQNSSGVLIRIVFASYSEHKKRLAEKAMFNELKGL